jgi:hypothetical protein
MNTVFRANELLSLQVGQVRSLQVGDVLSVKQSKTDKFRQVTVNRWRQNDLQKRYEVTGALRINCIGFSMSGFEKMTRVPLRAIVRKI